MNPTIFGRIAAITVLAASFLCAGPLGSTAWAQRGDTIRCESQNNNYRECPYFSDGEVRLMRQLSESRCDEGRSWGYDNRRRMVWVAQGCRGDFLVEVDRGRVGRDSDGRPEVRMGRNGSAEVFFSRDNCVVSFNPRGQRTSARGCSERQVREAEQAMEDSRGNQRFGGGGEFDRPQVQMQNNGSGRVFFDSNNCSVFYDTRGRRQESSNSCNGNQVRVADEMMTDYRRQNRF